jgi:hypothetical protein
MAEEKDKKRYEKPLPAFDEESRPFWEATKRHELCVQRCRDCGFVQYQVRAVCVGWIPRQSPLRDCPRRTRGRGQNPG